MIDTIQITGDEEELKTSLFHLYILHQIVTDYEKMKGIKWTDQRKFLKKLSEKVNESINKPLPFD